MKKFLIATTALVATASVAAADVTFGGYGRFGLIYDDGRDDLDDDDIDSTSVEQRFRLNINATTETDAGVIFGARIRFQSDDNSLTGRGRVSDNSAAEFNVRAGGLRVDVGNTSDVIDSGDIFSYFGQSVGLTDFAEISTGFALPVSGFGTSGSDLDEVPPTIKASFSSGPFTVAGSYTSTAIDNDIEEYQIGFGYSITDDIRIGAAGGTIDFNEEDIDDADFWTIGANMAFGAFTVDLVVADVDSDSSGEDVDTAYGAAFTYALGAATSLRFVVNDAGRADIDDIGGDDTAYAIGFRHSLGGGVSLRGGVGQNRFDNTVGDLGVRFDF